MELAITPLDVTDPTAVDEVFALMTAARAADVPDMPPPCRHWLAGALTFPRTYSRLENYVTRADGRTVGFLSLAFPLKENLENSDIYDLIVHPDYRRRGIGRALYAYAVERLRADGRKRTVGMTVATLPGGPQRDGAGGAFAVAMGAKNALGEVRRRLDLSTVDEDALKVQLAEAWQRADGYTLVQWRERAPDEYAADVGYLDGRMITDAPMGDIKWEPETVDVARVREGEARCSAMKIRMYSTGVVHAATNRMVAFTTIGFEESTPTHGMQWITIVDPDHRGHRLGIIVKIENLRYARAHEPGVTTVDTWNAAVNKHMIAINEAMGFRPVDLWENWQHEF
ncbi:MAG TPA: GNAT family N-acetyltransferase [Micromonosporaceae bacterium]|nr:GNAT family N-acetyltransferase [Micromonosporaceae bacterium]